QVQALATLSRIGAAFSQIIDARFFSCSHWAPANCLIQFQTGAPNLSQRPVNQPFTFPAMACSFSTTGVISLSANCSIFSAASRIGLQSFCAILAAAS